MNRKLISVCAFVGVGLAIAAFYFLSSKSPEEKRDRYLKGSREYIAQSKAIVEVHQGRIEVESEEGKGSTFRVMLPTNS